MDSLVHRIVETIKRQRQSERFGNVDIVPVRTEGGTTQAVCVARTVTFEDLPSAVDSQLKVMES